MITATKSVPIGLTRTDLVYYVCEAIEGSPDWAVTDPTMNALFDELLITGDVKTTLKKHIPDAEWKEAARLILTRAPHHASYTPPESFNDKAARIADEHKLHPVDAALLADVIEPPVSDECYVVTIHNEDWTVAELTAVPASAARFARRMARKEWVAAGNSADGIEFNARAAGPDA